MFKEIRKLIVGNSLGQVIQLSSLMILSRLYSPSDFGLLGQVQAFATFGTIIATLQMHLAIPLSKSKKDAQILTKQIQSTIFFLSLLFLTLAIFINDFVFYSVCLTAIIALVNTYSGYMIYCGNFSAISKLYVARAISIVFFQLLFSFLRVDNGLIFGALLAEALVAVYINVVMLDFRLGITTKIKSLLTVVVQNRSFSLYGTIQELISVAAFYMPLFLFGIYLDAGVAGQYAMASRLVWAPTVLISKNISQVFYHKHDALKEKIENLRKKIKFILILLVFLIIFIVSVFLCQDLFVLILGEQWGLAGQTIPIMFIWCAFFILSTPFRVLCRSLRLQKIQLVIDGILLLAIYAVFDIYLLSALEMMWVISLLGVLQNIILAVVVFCKLKNLRA